MSDDLYKDIFSTAAEFWSSTGAKKRGNMALVPESSWLLIIRIGDALADRFIAGIRNPNMSQHSIDEIKSLYRDSFANGLWVWIAEYCCKEPDVFKGKLSFDLSDAHKITDKWESLLDNLDKLIPGEVKPTLEAAFALLNDHIRSNNTALSKLLDPAEVDRLSEELKSAVIRGYVLPNIFDYQD